MLNYESKDFIFHYSKNYGSLTYATRLKVAVNMADLFLGTLIRNPTYQFYA